MSGKLQDSQPLTYYSPTQATTTLPPTVSYPSSNNRNGCCGCSTKISATVIAGLQIFFAVIGIIQAFVAMGTTKDFTSRLEEYKSSYGSYLKHRLVTGFASLALGLMLSAGIHYKKQTLFVIWLVFCGLQIWILGIGTIFLFVLFLHISGSAGFIVLLVGFLVIIILVSCFSVVNHHRKELADEEIQNQNNQVAQFSSVQVLGATPTDWNQ